MGSEERVEHGENVHGGECKDSGSSQIGINPSRQIKGSTQQRIFDGINHALEWTIEVVGAKKVTAKTKASMRRRRGSVGSGEEEKEEGEEIAPLPMPNWCVKNVSEEGLKALQNSDEGSQTFDLSSAVTRRMSARTRSSVMRHGSKMIDAQDLPSANK